MQHQKQQTVPYLYIISGCNGAGKTTLMKTICGLEHYDSGSRMVLNGTNIGYLAQITFVDEEKTVYEELLTAPLKLVVLCISG